jgi:ADP-ribosylglycohydrolase
MSKERVRRSVCSAAWAAYGDALGFIGELTDEQGLARRTQGRPLDYPMSWMRRIGGRQGVQVELPSGCYSDDTQLRLAVSRSIGPSGFDVEAFAKIELTVWPSYALGGGKGTKAAAANLCKENVTWHTNTFKGWTEAGGNGAAMRVQPHVWAAGSLGDPGAYVPDVVRDSICTHGSPVGILGAVLHSMFLAHTIEYGDIPSPDVAMNLVRSSRRLRLLVPEDSDVFEIWIGLWEREKRESFQQGWEAAANDAREATNQASRWARSPHSRYPELLASLDLYSPSCRGSGLLTTIAALALLWAEPDVEQAVAMAANAVGSDTDTIATMAGALGGVTKAALPRHVMDLDLICSEAERLAKLARGEAMPGHQYPDLLHWVPPSTQADALVQRAGEVHLLGLGPVQPTNNSTTKNGSFQWQWVTTSYGQTVLTKRRDVLPEIPDAAPPMRKNINTDESRVIRSKVSAAVQPTLTGGAGDTGQPPRNRRNGEPDSLPLDRGVSIDEVLRWLDSGRLSEDKAIGYVLRRVARDGSPEQMLLLVGALRERLRS